MSYEGDRRLYNKKSTAKWLDACDECAPTLLTLLTDPSVQGALSTVRTVPCRLHVHGGPLTPYISLRFAYHVGGGKYANDSIIERVPFEERRSDDVLRKVAIQAIRKLCEALPDIPPTTIEEIRG